MTVSALKYLRFHVGWVHAWHALWLLLAIAHVTQTIWLSGGAAVPASLGDGRFNQLVLEHGYQSLRGNYHWASPGQFHPTADTLGYSDTHAGTLPIYAASRWLGYSMEHAWQQWFVIVVALNAIAGLLLFGTLGIDRWLRAPLTFAAVASVTMVWVAGTHPQLLPIFPALLAWMDLVRWSRDRQSARLLRALGWLAWQFAAGPYLAFFGLAVGVFVAVTRLCAPQPSLLKVSGQSSWVSSTLIAAAGLTLAGASASIYRHAVQAGASRSLDEVRELAPRFQSWFTASPVHGLYPAGWPGGMTNLAEQAWLAGFLPWLLLIPAIVVGWRTRRAEIGAWMLACAGGAALTALFFTRWGDTGAWILLAKWVEPLRAFRAGGRVAGLMHVVQIAATGLLLTHLLASGARRRWLVGGLTALLLIEGAGCRQPSMDLAIAAKRANAVIAAWRAAGDRPVLAYAFSYSNQPEVYMHLDAWSAALRLHRSTLNGYSGNWPNSHLRFLWNSTADNAKQLIADVGLKADDVSLVEQISAADAAALGVEHLAGRQVAHLDDCDLQPDYWSLYSYLERHMIDDTVMYQFTPAAEVRFRVPDGASQFRYLVGFRPDAYTLGGKTDGAGVTWSLRCGEEEKVLAQELLVPLTNPAHRGLLSRELLLPEGQSRILILRTDTGPAHDLPWDFLLVGQLRVQ